MIPKIVHQCHTAGIRKLSAEDISAMTKLRVMNLDWDFKFYDLERMREFIMRNYEERYLLAFDKINPSYGVAQADYFRYLLMYAEGGVYLDVKSFTTKPLLQIIHEHDDFILYSWQNNPRGVYENDGKHDEILEGFEFQQWNIITNSHNFLLRKVIESVTNNIENYTVEDFGVGWKGVLKTTGPIPYTNAINSENGSDNIRFAGNNEKNGLIYRDDINFPYSKDETHYSLNDEPLILV